MKSFELISIFIEKEIEMPKLNQFLSQMSNLDSELRNFVFRNNPVSGPDLMTMTNFIAMFLVSVEDNVGHYKFLIFLNLMPLYIFAFILLYNLRDSAIFSNFENYQLLSKCGFKKIDIIFNSVLPNNLAEIIDTLSTAVGNEPVMSQETAVQRNPLVIDKELEMQKINEQSEIEVGTLNL